MSVRVMAAVWESSRQDGSALLLLLALADHANEDGWCWPSVATLAARARVGERAARRMLRELEAAGELETDVQRGRGHVNRYRVMAAIGGQAAPYSGTKGEQAAPFTQAEKGAGRPRIRIEKGAGRAEKGAVRPPEPSVEPGTGVTGNIPTGYSRTAAADAHPVRAVPKRNRGAEVIDLLRERGVPVAFTSEDGKALRESGADPPLVADAYAAAFSGEWAPYGLLDALSIKAVVRRLAGYQAWKASRARGGNGAVAAGNRRFAVDHL